MGNFKFGKEEVFLGGLGWGPCTGLDLTGLGIDPYWGLLGGPYEDVGGLYEVVGGP